jgi:hypothetical protein
VAARSPACEFGFESFDITLVFGIGGIGFGKKAFKFNRGKFRIDAGCVLDGFCANSKAECGERFGFVIRGRRAVDDEGCT